MLDSLITSKTRVKLLLKFFLNTGTKAYLRGLANELSESTNAVRVELNRLVSAGLLTSEPDGRTKLYTANEKHPLFPDLHNVVKKFLGIDSVIEMILAKLGAIELAFITGDYAKGIDSGIIDIVIVGSVDRQYLQNLIEKTEELIKRKIRILVLTGAEFERLKKNLNIDSALIVWNKKSC
jgi:hypothetical protein